MHKWLISIIFLVPSCVVVKAPRQSLEGQVSLRRVRVFNGPLAYVGQVPCTSAQIDVPSTYGIESVAFLENGESMTSCGKDRASVIVETGDMLNVGDFKRIRTPAGFVVACLIGESHPSELVLELTCLSP